MSFLALFKAPPTTASQARKRLQVLLGHELPSGSHGSPALQARERLQMLLAHERANAGPSDLITVLREEILAVIIKHASVERDGVRIRMERGASASMLGVSIDLPDPSAAARAI